MARFGSWGSTSYEPACIPTGCGTRARLAMVALGAGAVSSHPLPGPLALSIMKYGLYKKDKGQFWWWDSVRGKWTNLRSRASRFSYQEARREQARVGGSMGVLWRESMPLTSNIPF